MEVILRDHNGKHHNLDLPEDATVGDLESLTTQVTGTPVPSFRLIWNSKQLTDGRSPQQRNKKLSDYSLPKVTLDGSEFWSCKK